MHVAYKRLPTPPAIFEPLSVHAVCWSPVQLPSSKPLWMGAPALNEDNPLGSTLTAVGAVDPTELGREHAQSERFAVVPPSPVQGGYAVVPPSPALTNNKDASSSELCSTSADALEQLEPPAAPHLAHMEAPAAEAWHTATTNWDSQMAGLELGEGEPDEGEPPPALEHGQGEMWILQGGLMVLEPGSNEVCHGGHNVCPGEEPCMLSCWSLGATRCAC